MISLKADLPRLLDFNAEAVELNTLLYQVAEAWDDLIDGDAVNADVINATFYAAMVTVPRNPFYQRHFALLNPLVEAAILDWFTANDLEKTRNVDKLRTSYMLRCGLQAVTVMCARILKGVVWANAVNMELRTAGDTWAEYAAEFGVT